MIQIKVIIIECYFKSEIGVHNNDRHYQLKPMFRQKLYQLSSGNVNVEESNVKLINFLFLEKNGQSGNDTNQERNDTKS